jgi:hypothetical protein
VTRNHVSINNQKSIENDREPVKYKLRNHELADKLLADFTGMSEFLFYMGLLS